MQAYLSSDQCRWHSFEQVPEYTLPNVKGENDSRIMVFRITSSIFQTRAFRENAPKHKLLCSPGNLALYH